MVRTSTPASAHAIVMRRTFSVPAWWPASRGIPRRFAQRPLPSMMMPTCLGTELGCGDGSAWDSAPATRVTSELDLHNFGLLATGDFVDPLDELVGEFLKPILSAAFI